MIKVNVILDKIIWKKKIKRPNYYLKEKFNKLLNKLKIDNEEFYNAIKEQKIKNKLIKLTTDAFEKEVFGTPTFIINGKIFWGQDRLEYALEELKN